MTLPRFYPILDTELLRARGLAVRDAASALLRAGVRILQLRHKGQYTRQVFQDAQRVAEMCREAGADLIVDDRADIALLLDAGVHVGQDDLAPSDVRKVLGPSRMLGFSTHNREQLQATNADNVSYVAFGPIYTTSSKRNPDPVAGVSELRLVRSLTGLALVAIGGITRANATTVWSAGADSVAVIGDLYLDPLDIASLQSRAREWLALSRD